MNSRNFWIPPRIPSLRSSFTPFPLIAVHEMASLVLAPSKFVKKRHICVEDTLRQNGVRGEEKERIIRSVLFVVNFISP